MNIAIVGGYGSLASINAQLVTALMMQSGASVYVVPVDSKECAPGRFEVLLLLVEPMKYSSADLLVVAPSEADKIVSIAPYLPFVQEDDDDLVPSVSFPSAQVRLSVLGKPDISRSIYRPNADPDRRPREPCVVAASAMGRLFDFIALSR